MLGSHSRFMVEILPREMALVIRTVVAQGFGRVCDVPQDASCYFPDWIAGISAEFDPINTCIWLSGRNCPDEFRIHRHLPSVDSGLAVTRHSEIESPGVAEFISENIEDPHSLVISSGVEMGASTAVASH
ncbi:MAG: hypothetical protein U0936_03300 [Planctomycetaceae bacterium]